MYAWVESLTNHCVLCCDFSCCGDRCCAGSSSCSDGCCCCGDHNSCCGGGVGACCCDWLATCCDWITCGPCRTRCFGWAPCPTPDADNVTYGGHNSSHVMIPDLPLSSSDPPMYLELRGSADDNDHEIPYEKVFEMEQKKRRLFAAANANGKPGSGSLAQVH